MLHIIFYPLSNRLLQTQTLLIYNLNVTVLRRHFSSKDNDNYKNGKIISDSDKNQDLKIPEPPTNCCMAGCSTCVWVEYAEILSKMLEDSGEKTREIILSKVSDENMKAFLNMELKILLSRVKDKLENGNDK